MSGILPFSSSAPNGTVKPPNKLSQVRGGGWWWRWVGADKRVSSVIGYMKSFSLFSHNIASNNAKLGAGIDISSIALVLYIVRMQSDKYI